MLGLSPQLGPWGRWRQQVPAWGSRVRDNKAAGRSWRTRLYSHRVPGVWGLLGAVMVARESVTEGLDVEGTQDIPDSEQRLGHKKTEFRCHQFNI